MVMKKSMKGAFPRKGPFLFPRTNTNFSSGKYRPPSKNAGAQKLFQQNDPYARSAQPMGSQVLDYAQRAATPGGVGVGQRYTPYNPTPGTTGASIQEALQRVRGAGAAPMRSARPVGAVPYGSGPVNIGQPVTQPPTGGLGGSPPVPGAEMLNPAGQAAYAQFGKGVGSIGDIMRAQGYNGAQTAMPPGMTASPGGGMTGTNPGGGTYYGNSGAGSGPNFNPGMTATPGGGGGDPSWLAGLPPEVQAWARQNKGSGAWNTDPKSAAASAAAAFQGYGMRDNPFIDQSGYARMAGGYAPDMNAFQPAYGQYTSPVVQQAMQGLYQSFGIRPEDVEHQQNQWRPAGF